MRKHLHHLTTIVSFLFLMKVSVAQTTSFQWKIMDSSSISCPNNMLYIEPFGGLYEVPGEQIQIYDPSLPLSASNPTPNGIPLPNKHAGLAFGTNINSSSVSPTFYTTVYNSLTTKSDILYWNGSSWTNTGHSFPGGFINLGMGGNFMYGLTTQTGSVGVVYKYDGVTNPAYLTTVTGWSNGGPFDVSVDCNGNWSILKADGPQWLRTYDPFGNLLIQYSVSGLPFVGMGGGLAIINNKVYAVQHVGTISGSTINFVTPSSTFVPVGDYAACPDCQSITNMTEHQSNLIRIYPNPTSNEIHISSLISNNPQIKLYDTEGRLILTDYSVNEDNEIIIHCENFKKGLYKIVISEVDGTKILSRTVLLND